MILGRRGIRFEVTAVAVAVTTLILTVGAVVLVGFQRASLTTTIDQALIQRADDLTALVAGGADLDGTFPGGTGEGFAQLVTIDGAVLASTPNLSGSGPLPVELTEVSADVVRTVSDLEADDSFRLLTRPLGDRTFLHVGTEFELVADAAEALIALLTVVLPALVLASGGLIWWLVGRTLSPVEQIRSQVAEIESGGLDRRVPEPGTGDEIHRLAETMNDMLARLEASVERQKRFVADASHELRSPLTRIRSALEIGGPPTAEASDDQETVLGDVIEMQRLLEDLLFLARSDEGRSEALIQALDLDDLVISEARRIRSESAIRVDLTRVSGAHVRADPAQIRRAIRNLLENAQRHASERISISLTEEAGEALLIVADDGPGIPEADFERVFERFTRLDDSRTSGTGGTGLGLAIARHIVRSHGGDLALVSPSTAGATFELRLPLAD